MADTDEKEATLYDKIAEAYGTPFEPEGDQTRESWKEDAVRFFNDMDDKDFNELPEDVAAWVNEAADVMKKNRGSKRKSALPDLAGLDEAEAEEETGTKGRKGRRTKSTKEKAEKEEPKGRDPEANRYRRAARVMLKNFKGVDKLPSLEEFTKQMTAAGHDYSEMTLNRAHDAVSNSIAVAADLGLLKD